MFQTYKEIVAFITKSKDAELEKYTNSKGQNILQELIDNYLDQDLFLKLLSLPSLKFNLASSHYPNLYLRTAFNDPNKFAELFKKRPTNEEKIEFLKCFIGANFANSNLSDAEKKDVLKQIIRTSNLFEVGPTAYHKEINSKVIFKAITSNLKLPSSKLLSEAIIEIAKEEAPHEDSPVIRKFLTYEYFRAINTREKENIDVISSKLLAKFFSRIGKDDLRGFGVDDKIAGNILAYKMRYRDIVLRSVPRIEQKVLDPLVSAKEVLTNPKIYTPFLENLNKEMVDVLKKNGAYEAYLKYEHESQDKKSYIQVGNTQFVLNPTGFEHWNHVFKRVLSAQLKKYGIQLIDENDEYKVFYGYVDEKAADEVVKGGNIFSDNAFSQGGLIHGKYTHAIQIYLLTKAIESGQLKLPEGMSLKEMIDFIITNKIWGNTFDNNSANLDPAVNSDYEFCLDDNRIMFSKLMVIGESDKRFSCLSNYFSAKLDAGLVKICKYVESLGMPLTKEQVLLSQAARGGAFNAVKNFATPAQYYLWRDQERLNEGKPAKYTEKVDGHLVLNEAVINIHENGIVTKKVRDIPSEKLESPVATSANEGKSGADNTIAIEI